MEVKPRKHERNRSIHIRFPETLYDRIRERALELGFRNPTRYAEAKILEDIRPDTISLGELTKLLEGGEK